jgi:hypothetical protein
MREIVQPTDMAAKVDGQWFICEGTKDSDVIAIVTATDRDGGVSTEANARLIAAAPEMVALLTQFSSDYAPSAIELARYRQTARTLLARIEGKES